MLQIDPVLSFLDSFWTKFIIVAAGAATIWGFTKAFGALRKWLKLRFKNIKARLRRKKEFCKQMIESMNKINERLDKFDVSLNEINESMNQISLRLDDNDEATSTVMLLKMMWAYHNYVLENHPIPLDVQTALCVMYDQYKKNKKHNHVPDDFKIRIMNCRVIGARTNEQD